jgi:histidine triad (HIT) family protein
MTLFEKLIQRQMPADVVYEDDDLFAFRDVNPQAPVHVLIVPKRVISRLAAAQTSDADLLGRLLLAAGKIAEQLGLSRGGFRVVVNNGPDAGETVPHLHVHLLGGRAMSWPPG